MVDIIPLDLVVDVVVPMVTQVVVMVVPQMIFMDVVRIVPLHLNLDDDTDMANILNTHDQFEESM